MNKFVASVAVAATLATSTACDSFGQAMSAHKDVLARAAGHELSIDKAASLFALNPRRHPRSVSHVDGVLILGHQDR